MAKMCSKYWKEAHHPPIVIARSKLLVDDVLSLESIQSLCELNKVPQTTRRLEIGVPKRMKDFGNELHLIGSMGKFKVSKYLEAFYERATNPIESTALKPDGDTRYTMMKDDCLIGEFVVKEMDIDEELDATYRIHYISIAKKDVWLSSKHFIVKNKTVFLDASNEEEDEHEPGQVFECHGRMFALEEVRQFDGKINFCLQPFYEGFCEWIPIKELKTDYTSRKVNELTQPFISTCFGRKVRVTGVVVDSAGRKYYMTDDLASKMKRWIPNEMLNYGLKSLKRQSLDVIWRHHVTTKTDPAHVAKRFISPEIGYGVVATSQIRKGDFILEYVGEVLDNKTVSERAQHRPEGYSYVFYIDKTTSIDATASSAHLGRLVNDKKHDKANASMRCKILNKQKHACLFATETIPVGTEIRYDYQFGRLGKSLPWRTECAATEKLEIKVPNDVFTVAPNEDPIDPISFNWDSPITVASCREDISRQLGEELFSLNPEASMGCADICDESNAVLKTSTLVNGRGAVSGRANMRKKQQCPFCPAIVSNAKRHYTNGSCKSYTEKKLEVKERNFCRWCESGCIRLDTHLKMTHKLGAEERSRVKLAMRDQDFNEPIP